MGTSFERWEKDPFFTAAEEVQESTDRMESVYRLWVQERRDGATPAADLCRELHTALGTAKWQLEELERAVASDDTAWSAGEDTRTRHRQFVAANADRIMMVERSLRESNIGEGKAALSWIRLDEGERDELALFLSCPSPDRKKSSSLLSVGSFESGSGETSASCSKNSCHSHEPSSSGTTEKVVTGSTIADTGMVKILVSTEESSTRLMDELRHPPRIIGFSGLSSDVESATKTRWYRNGFRKWKGGYQHGAAESIPLQNHDLSRGIDACYERSKSCLSNCDDTYEKQLDGWTGTIHRQLQRSQYQIQYGRPVQMIIWAILTFLLIGCQHCQRLKLYPAALEEQPGAAGEAGDDRREQPEKPEKLEVIAGAAGGDRAVAGEG